jgi:RND family efflux transporter MFP subunit
VATAEDVAADQAAVDAAGLQLTVAEQAARQAQLVSPINGTIGALDLAKGTAVQAGSSSSTPSVVVIGTGGYEVSTTVSDLDLDQVKVGSSVHATPDESGQEVDGTVTSIGILPTTSGSTSSSTSGGSATYPVTIALADESLDLHSGTSADVAIVLARATSAVTVPTSAVHRLGTGSFVYVVRNGKESTVRVTLGAVGRELTQVTDGLQNGDQVVLANLDASIPTSTASTRTGRSTSGFGGSSSVGGGAAATGGSSGAGAAPPRG